MKTTACQEQFQTTGEGLLVRAPAKINLSLLVAGKRPDGFHELETVMAKVSLYDEVLIEPGRKAGIELECKGPYWAPESDENLVYKACKLFMDSCGLCSNVKITLTKNIPAGSGLGSGSSDAAATLLGVNDFLQLSLSRRCLQELAPKLGSDVAFFLDGPLALCTGRGEKVKKLEKKFDFWALLILPDVSVSTKKVYANYEHDSGRYEKYSRQISSCVGKNRIDLVSGMCANMLEKSCFNLYEELAKVKAEVESVGIKPLCLSGSGSAMFCILNRESKTRVEEYREKLEETVGCKSVIVRNNGW